MKVGTKSVLWGVHAFWWHPLTVLLAWRKLYGAWPSWKESIAILLHDVGYIGCPNLDGEEGRGHPYRGAHWAGKIVSLFKPQSYWEVFSFSLRHSRSCAREMGMNPSALSAPDKFSILWEPKKWYLFRARLTGEVAEFKANAISAKQIPVEASDENWLNWYMEKVKEEFERVCWIPLTQGEWTKVDLVDAHFGSEKWYANRLGGGLKLYAARSGGPGKPMRFLSREILQAPTGLIVDHINGDTLDNRRSNLRLATPAENRRNTKKQEGHTSKFLGVFWAGYAKKWASQIQLGGKSCHLGYFLDEEDAARRYDCEARSAFGCFAKLNFPL